MFRFVERWQASVANAWNRSLAPNEELMRLLEDRDRQLEDYFGRGEWNGRYDPIVDQGGVVTHTVAGDLQVVHGIAFWSFFVSVTGAGAAGSAVRVQLPTSPAKPFGDTANYQLGYGMIFDASTSTRHFGGWEQDPGYDYARFASDTSAGNLWGIVPGITLASGDQLRGNLIYKVANP